jgi:hypothetical protein
MRMSFFIVIILLVLGTGILCAGCVQNPGNNQAQGANSTPTSVPTAGQSSNGVPTESPVAMATPNAGQTPTPAASGANGTLVVAGVATGQGQLSTLTIWKLPPELASKILSGGALTSNRADVLLSDYRIGNASTYQFSSEFDMPMQGGTYLLAVNQSSGNLPAYYLTTIVPNAISDVYVGERAVAAHVSFTIPPYEGV